MTRSREGSPGPGSTTGLQRRQLCTPRARSGRRRDHQRHADPRYGYRVGVPPSAAGLSSRTVTRRSSGLGRHHRCLWTRATQRDGAAGSVGSACRRSPRCFAEDAVRLRTWASTSPRGKPWTGEIDDEPRRPLRTGTRGSLQSAMRRTAPAWARRRTRSRTTTRGGFNFGATLLDWMARARLARVVARGRPHVPTPLVGGQRLRAGLPPRDPPALFSAGQGDRGPVGVGRFRALLRAARAWPLAS